MGRLFVAALLAAVLAGRGSAGGATGVLAIGDFGVGGDTERSMGATMRSWERDHPADVLVTLGDNDYTESPSAFHRNWVDAFGWLGAAGVTARGTLGNHDVRVDGGRYEFDELNMPRARYTRTVGSIHFFLLNSNRVGAKQTAWLEHKLAASTARWKIAVFHHPAYTCGAYRSHPGVVARWVPLFERYGVDLVLSGHDHNYQRFAPRNGVRYVVHGGGGPKLYAVEPCPAGYPKRVAARARRGFVYLRVTDARLRGRSVTRAGNVIDRFAIYP